MSSTNIDFEVKHTPESFRMKIEKYVSEFDLSYMDAILFYCENEMVDIESIPSLMKGNSKILAELQIEAENLNILEKESRLPI